MTSSSIRRALNRRLVIALLLVLALTGAALQALLRRLLTAQFDLALEQRVRMLAAAMKEDDEDGLELDLAEIPMPEFERAVDPEYFQVWLAGGGVFARSPSLAGQDLPRRSAAALVVADLPLPDGRRGRAGWLEFPVRLDEEHRQAGTGRQRPIARAVVARSRAPLDQALGAVFWGLATVGLLLLVVVPAVVRRSVRQGLGPLDQLADRAQAIDARTLDTAPDQAPARFALSGLPDELRPIATRLDQLLDRLRASFRRERRFSADVAHELRTPIAELRSLAEVALAAPRPAVADQTAVLRDVLAAALQMERLVVTLLSLARCEAGRQPVTREPVDLRALTAEAWSTLAARARDRAVTIEAAGETGPTLVQSDRVLLAAIITNLASNAVEYTPAGGAVRWEVSGTEVTITNSNRTLEASDLPHLFEAFWRKDAARSDGAHGGLGLTLVRAYARLLGAEVGLDLPSPDRVCARLVLRREPV